MIHYFPTAPGLIRYSVPYILLHGPVDVSECRRRVLLVCVRLRQPYSILPSPHFSCKSLRTDMLQYWSRTSQFYTPIMGSVIALMIQLFFCYRIWVIKKSALILSIVIAVVSTIWFGAKCSILTLARSRWSKQLEDSVEASKHMLLPIKSTTSSEQFWSMQVFLTVLLIQLITSKS